MKQINIYKRTAAERLKKIRDNITEMGIKLFVFIDFKNYFVQNRKFPDIVHDKNCSNKNWNQGSNRKENIYNQHSNR